MSSKKIKYSSSFQKAYTDEFPCIVSSRKGNTFAMCIVCQTDFSVAHGGRSDVLKHVSTQKHKDKVKCVDKNEKLNFFSQSKDQRVINAECLFSAFLVEHNLPLNVSDHAASLFRKMFPDSEIAKKYSSARTKTTAIVKEMGMEYKSEILDLIRTAPFCVSTDGSNNTDSKLYPIVVTCFNPVSSEIVSNLLTVPALEGDSTGHNIAQLIIKTLKENDVPLNNCLALGADNAPVMIGAKAGVAGILKNENSYLHVVGCVCHLINLAAEKGATCLPVKIDESIVDIYYYLEKSSKRKEKLKRFQQIHNTETRKILKHVCTRWLSLGICLSRILEQWNPLVSFFKEEVKVSPKISMSLDSYKIPKVNQNTVIPAASSSLKKLVSPSIIVDSSSQPCTSRNNKRKTESESSQGKKIPRLEESPLKSLSREERIFMFLSSDVNKAYCLFVQFILPMFDVPNKTLQSRVPKIHILDSILRELFKDILSKFVKPCAILCADSIYDVDYHQRDNQKEDEDLVVGTATGKIVADLSKKDQKQFYVNIRKYLCRVCNYILHKFPIKDEVVLHAKVADVSRLPHASFSDIKFFLNRFPILSKLILQDNDIDAAVDIIQTQFCSLQLEDLEEVKKIERIDTQWSFIGKIKSADGNLKYSDISKVMLAILTLPHSNAECERIFSIVTKTKTKFRPNLSDDTLEKVLLAKTGLRGNCYEQIFDTAFLNKAKSAATVNNILKNE